MRVVEWPADRPIPSGAVRQPDGTVLLANAAAEALAGAAPAAKTPPGTQLRRVPAGMTGLEVVAGGAVVPSTKAVVVEPGEVKPGGETKPSGGVTTK